VAAGKFAKAAAALLRILDDERSAVAGGMAVNAHGYIRATQDVDVITELPLPEARRRLRAQGVDARLFKGDPHDGDFPCLKGVIAVGDRPTDAVPFDVLPALVPVTAANTVQLTVRDQALRVVNAVTLIDLKLAAAGPNDLYDVAILVALHPELEANALALASAKGKKFAERVLKMIRDPRVRAQAREAERQDKVLRAFRVRRS
jgi:hypothetical protein